MGGGVSGGPRFTLPRYGAVTEAAERDSGRGSCRVVLLKLIRRVTPATRSTVCVCVCLQSGKMSTLEWD